LPSCYATIRAWKPLPNGVPAVPTTLAEHLRRRRFDLGHSQPEAAALIGVSPDTLQKWEAKGVLPDPGVLDAVEDYLGLCFARWTRAVGVRLKAWRRVRELDQPTAARRIGVCLETVTKLERGRLGVAALEARGRVFDEISDVTARAAGGSTPVAGVLASGHARTTRASAQRPPPGGRTDGPPGGDRARPRRR
jgi:DNA-binding XRE family transcriptional regulator